MQQELPPELYAEIAGYLSSNTLVSLAAASRKLNGIANRALYARIVLNAASARLATVLLRTLHDNQALNLTYFSVSPSIGTLTWIFDDVLMPSLVQFHSYREGQIAATFLERHPKLTHLTLCQTSRSACGHVLENPMQQLVYLRISCYELARDLLVRGPRHPRLRRIVFGRFVAFDVIISFLVSFPATVRVPHLSDILGNPVHWLWQKARPHALVLRRITSLGLSLCVLTPEIPIDLDFNPLSSTLRLLKRLFPNTTALTILCSDRQDHHEHNAVWAFDAFMKAIDEEGLQDVCVSEFLGCPVMAIHRDGEWTWACAPEDNRDPKEYQAIPWPQE
ncbi:hypothetical protein AURDEDRAFT_123696 [Auricularia subglabra TFB-10046 SS5]|nr:hypothetical protein AURDEDRAFT_123696 [Auricularia subglabra TFB-10046 SS5]